MLIKLVRRNELVLYAIMKKILVISEIWTQDLPFVEQHSIHSCEMYAMLVKIALKVRYWTEVKNAQNTYTALTKEWGQQSIAFRQLKIASNIHKSSHMAR